MSDAYVRKRIQRLAQICNMDEVVAELSHAVDQRIPQFGETSGSSEMVRQIIKTVMKEQQMATIESKLIRPPKPFDGSREKWKSWSFGFESLIRLLKYHDTLKECETKKVEELRPLVDMQDEAISMSNQIYYLLSDSVGGVAISLSEQCEEGNGFEA